MLWLLSSGGDNGVKNIHHDSRKERDIQQITTYSFSKNARHSPKTVKLAKIFFTVNQSKSEITLAENISTENE